MTLFRAKWRASQLGWGMRELATKAGLSTNTVARFERGEALKPATLSAIRAALEAAGVAFTNGDEPGVKLARKGDAS